MNLQFVADMCDNSPELMADFVQTFIDLVKEFDAHTKDFLLYPKPLPAKEREYKELCHKIFPTYEMFLLEKASGLVKEIEHAPPGMDIRFMAAPLIEINAQAIKNAENHLANLKEQIEISLNQQNQ